MSGASKANLKSRYFRLRAHSPRMHFRNVEQESRWHREWQAAVKKMQKWLEKKLEKLLGKKPPPIKLIDYDRKLPRIKKSDKKELPDKPFRFLFEFDLGISPCEVEISFKKAPDPDFLKELVTKIRKKFKKIFEER